MGTKLAAVRQVKTRPPSGLTARSVAQARRDPAGHGLQLQRAAASSHAPSQYMPIVQDVLRSPGQPLDPSTRGLMEPRFGYDFGAVRVHTDARAARSARAVHALAYTVGRHVVFGAAQFAPHSGDGQRLLAHELTHVVQQGSASESGLPTSLTISQPEDAAEREAAGVAEGISAGGPVHPQPPQAAAQIQRTDYEDCSADHEQEVRAAVAAALPAIVRTVNRIMGTSTEARDALIKYFGQSGPDHAVSIARDLLLIRAGLPDVTIECENPGTFLYGTMCTGASAYVRSATALTGIGNIHVCQPAFHNASEARRMEIIVHEGSHRFNDTDDNGYYDSSCNDTSQTSGLSDEDRRDNADSYGCLVSTLG